MNYYELHIGDYAEATGHLSILEDGVYGRLLRKYYASEKPLPRELKEVQRLVGCRSTADRQAVERVLGEFFECMEDGWHQHRCDEEIERYLESEPDREAKRENDKERKRRSREHRSQLFQELRELGVTPKWDTSISELEKLRSRLRSQRTVTDKSQTGHSDMPVTVTDLSAPRTASQSPVPNPQSPIPIPHTLPDPDQRAERKPEKGSVCGSFTKIGGEPEPSNGLAPRVYQSTEDVMADLRREHQRARK